ncbi:hypothetical protein M3175_20985 [Robertmurraya korlensis]|uniref:hypothetical protein n=1 Tax=Robertmurraya korlensis TaxID=519977 RepID=UPI00203CFCF6|nr:hypothetical protein [Robertmurraya korlensis]MCM3603217.1 hypothetical protein [Robertmurraya korlensis]
MNFINLEQEKSFFKIKDQIPANLNSDRGLLSIAYIMASNDELETKMAPYIDWIEGFDYEKLFAEETFSIAEEVLVKVAVALYDNGVNLQFNEVFTKLNQYQREIALHAANYKYDNKSMYEPEDGNLYIK